MRSRTENITAPREKSRKPPGAGVRIYYMSKKENKKPNTKAEAKTAKAEDGADGRRVISRPAFIILALVAVAFLIYSMVSIINIQSQLRSRRAELDELKEQLTVQEIKNEEMQKLYDSTGTDFSALAEQIARDDLDYVKEGERVFVNVSGD